MEMAFTDVAAESGVLNNRYTKAVVWGITMMTWIRLYVSISPILYRNNGDGTFTDVAPALGVDLPIMEFSSVVWDFNNDGAIDIFVGSYEIVDGTGAKLSGLPFKARHSVCIREMERVVSRSVAPAEISQFSPWGQFWRLG